ncbi:MAG TPA: glycosyltransferase family 4 protein [Solirubrobacteraceae bacterium]|jgi:glycosyltransferase involved in cell wall biosynthesis
MSIAPRRDARDETIAIVSSAAQFGGAELSLLALCDVLHRRVPLRLLASAHGPEELYRRAARIGVAVDPIGGLARRPSPLAVLRLIRALRRARPALVHLNLSDQGDGLVGLLAARALRIPVTATLRLVLPERRRALERLSHAALSRAGEVIAVSDSVAQYLAGASIDSTTVYNGIDPVPPTPSPRALLGLEPDAFVVGGIGRLDVQKGWDVLCAAAALVRRRLPQARFVIVGDGPQRGALEEPAAAAGVELVGYREQAGGLVPAFDVFAVPSRYEGFGRVAVEAMLGAVPVVACSAGGLREVVGDSGLLVPVDDPGALADAILSLAENPGLRAELGRRGAERARTCFGRQRMAEETLAVWRRVLGGSGAASL